MFYVWLLTQDCASLILGYYPLPLRGKRNPPITVREQSNSYFHAWSLVRRWWVGLKNAREFASGGDWASGGN
jgi:hypothetical protein